MVFPEWEQVFGNVDLGDERRNSRIIRTAKVSDNKTEIKGLSGNFSGHGEVKAVLRLLKSPTISYENIVSGFCDLSCQGLKIPHVLIVEDTSEFNFSWRKTKIKGFGPTGNGEDQGFFIHPAILVDPVNRTVEGMANLNLYTRIYGEKTTENDSYKYKEIEEKESFRWLSGPQSGIKKIATEIKKTIVADREADIFELFEANSHGKLGENTEILVRASRNRNINNRQGLLFEQIHTWDTKGKLSIEIQATKTRAKRIAECEIRFNRIQMDVPKILRTKKGKEAIGNLFVIDLQEINPPSTKDVIHWTLLTTWEINCLEDAIEKIEWYRSRWMIEELFRILKSGYHIESVRINNGQAIMNWCALRLIMALKVLVIKSNRYDETPDSAKKLLSDIELKVLKGCASDLLSPNSQVYRPPEGTIAWASLFIAIMGGYKATPSAKPFGQTNIWRGIFRLEGAVIGYHAALKCGYK